MDHEKNIWNLSWNLGKNSGTYLEPKYVFSGTYVIIQVVITGNDLCAGELPLPQRCGAGAHG